MDACDPASCILANRLATSTGLQRLHVVIFSEHELQQATQRGLTCCRSVVDAPSNKRYTPMCWMWERLALYAHHHLQAAAFVLLGDDTQTAPTTWVEQVLGEPHSHFHATERRVETHDMLLCLQGNSMTTPVCTAWSCETLQTQASHPFQSSGAAISAYFQTDCFLADS